MENQRIGINNGIFLGLVLILFNAILTYVNPVMFLKLKSTILIVPFFLILLKAGRELRRKQDGIARFNELFLTTFICASIAILMCSTYEYLQFNFLFPETKDIFIDLQLEAMEASKALLGEENIQNNIEMLESTDLFSPQVMFTQMLLRFLLPGALISSIISLILKRSKIKTND